MAEETLVVPAAPAAPVVPAGSEATPAQDAVTAAATPEGGDKPETAATPADKPEGLSRRERRAIRRAAEEKARADFLQKQYDELAAKRPAPAPADDGPRMDQFSDIEEYASAKARHEVEKARRQDQAKSQGERERQYQEGLVSQWEQRAAKGDRKYDDFEEKVGDLKPSAPWAIAVIEADNGEDIAYWLATHIEDARTIASLHPAAQIRAIGRLEAKLLAEPPKPKEPSKAPPPITPVSGTKPAADPNPSDEDDMGTWMKKRNRQVHGR